VTSLPAVQLQVDSVSVTTLDSTSGQPLEERDVQVITSKVVVLAVTGDGKVPLVQQYLLDDEFTGR
jgi:DNA mismatch repair protein MutH